MMSSLSKNLQAFLIASRTGSRLLTLAGAGLLSLILLQSASLWLDPIEERVVRWADAVQRYVNEDGSRSLLLMSEALLR